MEAKMNIAELLKDCPKGMKIDCTMYEDVYFDYVDELNIIHCYIQGENYVTSITFNQYGTHNSDIKSKCVIFPKGKTTWEGFQRPFKDGDFLAYESSHTTVFIYRNKNNEPKYTTSFYVGYTIGYHKFHIYNKDTLIALNGDYNTRLATEEEKAKLFDAIKANGYRWNAETKTLEKLPKFKVGDRITNGKTSIKIGYIDNEYYYEIGGNIANRLCIKNQDEWNLVPNKFDINTLKPFESKVLVRDTETDAWKGAFYSHYRSKKFYVINGSYYYQCIPYKGNEYLLGTTDDCDEYYKTWE